MAELMLRLFVDDDKEVLSGNANDAYPGQIEAMADKFVKFVQAGRLDTIEDGRTRRVTLEWSLDAETVARRKECGQLV